MKQEAYLDLFQRKSGALTLPGVKYSLGDQKAARLILAWPFKHGNKHRASISSQATVSYFSAQLESRNSFLIQIGLYLVGIPALWANQYTIERFGRRPMLLVTVCALVAVLLIVGGCGVAPTKSLALDRTIVAMVFVFMIVFNLSLDPAIWVVTSEISTGHDRNKLMASSTATNWFCSRLVTFTFPYLFNSDGANLGAIVGFIYAGLLAAAAVWLFVFLPETSGRSLEEIQTLFAKHVPARKFKSYVIPGAFHVADLEEGKISHVVQVEQP